MRDGETAQIETDFSGWSVWRATNRHGQPGDFVATRLDPRVGTDPTVIRSTGAELRTALTEQRHALTSRPRT